ncbi:preprotein translocase subunit SecA [Conexibacter arvalis]|uniref:Protein translocase subunit SecA n=1 Tax=Conexibacter arvalis TaxID=912552 RepID=A0A840IH91_9ACTN|nr:preprotein translocase subunit SecA [Conexibacter arvalis]MBB4664427.1 preprotein translocase subunit SecA [Conexibacter arvalis]
MSLIDRALRLGEGKKFKGYEQRVAKINALEPEYEAMSDEELREAADELRERARGENAEPLDDLLYDCFALVREAGRRTMGMRHFDVQMIGGMVLHDGNIAEMRTGEGKTLTGTLPAILNSLAGKGVHIVTVNDYLARRDCEWMSPIYDLLGVSYGVLQNMQPAEEKRAAYAADITYGTNSEFGFDYLRDNMAGSLEDKVQHGGRDLGEIRSAKDRLDRRSAAHTFAIVDEVDNILIDEARTPLIISGAPEEAGELYARFARLAPMLTPGRRPEGMDPRQKKEFVADYDYEFDEKHRTVSITERGVEKAERFLGIDHLYRAENGHLVNHLIQSLRAQALYRRDVDYAVIDGEVVIIDEFTGRILEGRRWSEGLHQAVEAKEGVAVTEENQTMATITYQNYFRLYDKLSGMTGTAITEATEFMKIYRLGVVQVPTNRPMIRIDQNDQVFKTKEGKWTAVVDEIVARHEKGQPVLVGTISVEVSELLGERLRRHGVPHTVLNAKPEHAEREGETVAEAGRPGAVTIATNMAGRGVDIKLGGNAEHLVRKELAKLGLRPGDPDYEEHEAKLLPQFEERVAADRAKVEEAGGLCIIGTERHESRRIDNQLRGRAGRQGDPGETRFYLSAEDDLVRLFAGERIYKILDRFGTTDDEGKEEPIEAGLLSKQIEKAQKKVEEQNFLIRKRVLEYDDVMNEQRRIVYAYRDEVLEGRDMGDEAREQIGDMLARMVEESTPGDYIEDWDVDGLFARVGEIFPLSIGQDEVDPDSIEREELIRLFADEAMRRYDEREEELGDELMRMLERYLLLQIIDQRWQEHLYDMDYLREGIHLRGFAQIEPIVAYKNEGYRLFQDLMNTIWSDFARMIFNVQVQVETGEEQQQAAPAPPQVPTTTSNSSWTSGGFTYSGSASSTMAPYAAMATDPDAAALGAHEQPAPEEPDAGPRVEQRRVDAVDQIGRNDPCWCGSGKKYKKCHGS